MRTVVLLLISFFAANIFGQPSNLFVPRNVLDAYNTGTRSFDGKPGDKYWQNGSDYKIFAEVIPSERKIKGIEEITYYNNSPHELNRLVFRLYQDIYKKGAARDFPLPENDINEGMIIDRFVVNGKEYDTQSRSREFNRIMTNLMVALEDSLAPGESVKIEIGWSFVLPEKGGLRMGTYDETSFYVAYWYPQVSVFDDIDGWDTFNYGGMQEYYNDFSNYEVEITVPENFVVWGTGVLQNPKEVFDARILEKYQKALTSDEIISIIDSATYSEGIVTNKGKNTYKFNAEYVPDFVFATSDHYLWDLTSTVVDSSSGRRTVIGAAYKKESEDFYQVAEISKKSILYFSNTMPAYPFPYPTLTVFNGSGGMESPMMINDGSSSTIAGTIGVTSHEITHQYMPFMMGTNERKYAFMDEGWAVMLPFEFQIHESNGEHNRKLATIAGYERIAGTEEDTPLLVPSTELKNTYRNSAYVRSAAAYLMLYEFLGEELFLNALHGYMNRWQGKHPTPWDFYFTFNDVLKDDLSWFWNPWFNDFSFPDLGIKEVKNKDGKLIVTVEKIGGQPVPIYLETLSENGETLSTKFVNDFWKTGDKEKVVELENTADIRTIKLGNDYIPDSNDGNNFYEIK
ncbi:MAG: M1 family metallopeptidase [Melioribacteraceae bacterium]|nr:M1 family metallopeptidase [Melioribacteraceae bacterium]